MRSFFVLIFLMVAVAEARTAELLDLEEVNSAELKARNFTKAG